MKIFMVHPQLKFSCVLPLKLMCTYTVHILIYSSETVENASGAVSTMPTSSLISNLNSVTDDSDYDYENNPIVEFEFDTKLDYFD